MYLYLFYIYAQDLHKAISVLKTNQNQETIEINYDPKLKEIENVLKAYSKRYLSLIGKITVIKTLVIPKLVYLLSVLPWPGSHFIQTVEDMFRRFIWNNGKARISLIQLQKDIPEGGFKLTDLVTFNLALKISWIKRLIKGIGNWQDIFEFTTGLNKTLVWDLRLFIFEKNIREY